MHKCLEIGIGKHMLSAQLVGARVVSANSRNYGGNAAMVE